VIHYISQSKATKQHCTTSLETSNVQSSDRDKCNPTFLQLFETEDRFYAAHNFLNPVLLTLSYIQVRLQ
jgi:hypothetical protein